MAKRSSDTDISLRLYVLGGFRAERRGYAIPAGAWRRRATAKSLIKLLALHPAHRMHREEILAKLWPEAPLESAINSFGKALHAARHALEPELQPHVASSYLHLVDNLLTLDCEHVWLDLAHFERVAARALLSGVISDFEAALAAYGGEVLPEDRYEEWTMSPREAMNALHMRVLRAYASALERAGMYDEAEDVLEQVIRLDPLREDAQRRLMLLEAASGNRPKAMQLYEAYRELLRREVGVDPEPDTRTLFDDIRMNRVPHTIRAAEQKSEAARLPAPARKLPPGALVGREPVLQRLRSMLSVVLLGTGQVVLMSGEAGIGKSRMAQEVAREGADAGCLVLWGAGYFQESGAPYGPFADALESYAVTRTQSEREEMSSRYPLLVHLLPSLAAGLHSPAAFPPDIVHGHLVATFISVLRELAASQPVVLVLDNLHRADTGSLQLLYQLALAAPDSRWLILGTYRDDEVQPGSKMRDVITSTSREDVSQRIALQRLSQEETYRLVESILSDGTVAPALLHRIYSFSLGNPLFVHELVRTMREEDAITLLDGRWELSQKTTSSVPSRVRDLVVAQLDRLGARPAQLLYLAATMGTEWSVDELRTAARLAFPSWFDEEILLETLDGALEAQLLDDHSGTYAFRYPLVRAALEEETPSHRSISFHSAAAAAIEHRKENEVTSLYFTCHGVPLGIQVPDPEVLERLMPLLPPGWQPADSCPPENMHTLLRETDAGGRVTFRILAPYPLETADLAVAIDHMISELHHHVALEATDGLFLHAGVVAWRGRALVLPGRSRSGKSSLVAALVRAGATYYSDEYAVLDAVGRVYPYPKPLALRGTSATEPRSHLSAEELGGSAGHLPLPVGLVAVTRYRPGSVWKPTQLTSGQAMLALLDNTVLARARAETALQTYARVLRTAVAVEGTHGETMDLAAWLLDFLDHTHEGSAERQEVSALT